MTSLTIFPTFHDGDFGGGEVVEFVDDLVNVVVGGGEALVEGSDAGRVLAIPLNELASLSVSPSTLPLKAFFL